MHVCGLSGGIACGKSTAARLLAAEGITILDCDELSRVTTRKGNWGWRRVRKAFSGEDIFCDDGSIDRDKLGDLIFSSPEKRKLLNQATHLPILVSICRRAALAWLSCNQLMVIDMPLLFETRSDKYMGFTVVVSCPREQQLQRLQARDGISAKAANAKIDAQMPLVSKVKLADFVLDNSSSQDELDEQVKELVRVLRARAKWQWLLSPIGFTLALACLLCVKVAAS